MCSCCGSLTTVTVTQHDGRGKKLHLQNQNIVLQCEIAFKSSTHSMKRFQGHGKICAWGPTADTDAWLWDSGTADTQMLTEDAKKDLLFMWTCSYCCVHHLTQSRKPFCGHPSDNVRLVSLDTTCLLFSSCLFFCFTVKTQVFKANVFHA